MAPEQKVGTESLSPFGIARTTIDAQPLSKEEVELFTKYFHATLYLCLGMIYLKENPLLQEPLKVDMLKRRLLGHWGSDAGQSFTYLHFNRLIKKYDIDAIFVSGPG
jgi:xylulose-5-phosphate/fructose-6-phosphate phosphoketolase